MEVIYRNFSFEQSYNRPEEILAPFTYALAHAFLEMVSASSAVSLISS
jgi:hypothetical protein